MNGNHETMNVEGDFRYVDSGGFDECAEFLQHMEDCKYDWENAFVSWIRVSKKWKGYQKSSQNYWDSWNLVKVLNFSFSFSTHKIHNRFSDMVIEILGQRQKGVIARSLLLKPGGPLACELARHPVILRVNDWIFCHGGLLPHHGKCQQFLLVPHMPRHTRLQPLGTLDINMRFFLEM